MKVLPEFFQFIKDNCLEAAARENLRLAREVDLPLMQFYKDVPEEALLAQAKKSLSDMADTLEDGTYFAKQVESLRKWEEDRLDNAPANVTIQPKDLVLIYAMQRKMVRKFLPQFTADQQKSLDVLQEMDNLQTASQEAAMEILFRKQQKTEEQARVQNHLLDHATDAILTTDNDRRITYCNKACERMFGFSKQELLGRISSEAFKVDPAYEALRTQRVKELSEKGNSGDEIVYLSKSGEPVPVLISASEIRDGNGDRTGFFVIFKDIRDRAKHEQQLEELNRFLNTILENIPNMIFVKDAKELRFVRFNKAGEELLGIPREEMAGKNDYDFFSKEQADFFTSKDRQVLEGGKLVDIKEEQINTRTHGPRWLHTRKLPVTDENGKPVFLLGISDDITEQRKAEEALRESEMRFRLIVDSLKDYALFMVDPEGHVVSWNRGAERIKGYTAEEIIGKHISTFYTEDEIVRNEPEKNLRLAAQLGSHETEGWRKRKNGELFWADVVLTAIYDNEGKLKGFAKITRDMTEKKRSEDKVRQLNTELGQSVSQLNAVNKELEAFTYSVSHDLRAPLRAVNGYANMLEEDFGSLLDDEGKRLLGVIRYNAQKMGQLIDDLLAFSRLGRKDLERTPEDMNQLVEGALIEVNKNSKYKADIRIGKLHRANVDYGLMHQAFVNLISNALKYSSKKEKPAVEISSEDTGDEVIYSIKDNGAGFDMRYYDKLFGVFQRLHKMEEFEGTGVGLAIVQRVIAKHKGRVWAKAEVDKGATFFFALPKN